MPRVSKARRPRKPPIDPLEASIMAQVEARSAEIDAELAKNGRNDYTQNDHKTTEMVRISEDTALRLDNFYVLLGVTKEEVEEFPKITSIFESIGGVEAVIGYLRASDDRIAHDIVRLYGLVPIHDVDIHGNPYKLPVPFEALCVSAKVTKRKFFQILMGEVSDQSDMMSNILAANAHPKVVQETIRVAVSDEWGAGEARSILHRHRGFLPTPKTQNVNIRGNASIDNRVDNSQNATINIGDLEFGNEAISKSVDRFNEVRVFKVENTDEEAPFEAEIIETGQ